MITPTIILPNIDGKIWNVEHKVIDIVNAYDDSGGRVVISLNSEGPCAESLGLYTLLDSLCDNRGYKKSNITILTNNVIESHPEYQIKKSGPLYLDSVKDFVKSHQFPEKSFNTIKHFGMFVGRSNWLSLWIASNILVNYSDNSLLTFHYNYNFDFHQDHLGLDELVKHHVPHNDIDSAVKLIQQSPLILDNAIPEYPIITPAHFEIAKMYDNFFAEIVCETYCQGNTFYPTEKLWRPIAMKTPFIIQGPINFYHNLHKMGFKTFSTWWDEGFTNDNYAHQPKEIFKILNHLSMLSKQELEGLYIDMTEILEHNYNLLLTLHPHNFVKAFN
jgi:hypothetical protein